MEISRRARTSETPQITQGPARGSCLVQSQGLALPWSLLIISPWIAAVAPFQKLADDAEQSAKTRIHMHWFPSGNLKPRTTLSHTSAFLCVLWVSPLKYTETLVWTELQSPQGGGHPKAPHTKSGRNFWGYEDPSNTLFFFTQMAMVVSQEKTKSLAWEHKTGFQWGHRPGKQSRICSWLIYSCYLIISHLAVQSSLAH